VTLIIDVSYVTSIDAAGRDLFRRWHAAVPQFVARSKRAQCANPSALVLAQIKNTSRDYLLAVSWRSFTPS
jgi:hypothetical protein